ncbi:MAG: hypothetical protein ACI9EP_001130 [Oceanospirillaceae bacterium]
MDATDVHISEHEALHCVIGHGKKS